MKVSVITPVFNGEKTIEDCIKSIQSQDYDDVEHVVVDGGSTDGTLDIVKRYGVKYISEQDAGVYDAFNKGISLSSGNILHILNADDFYHSTNRISMVVRRMAEENLDLCHGYVEQTDDATNKKKRIGKDVDRNELFWKMRVAHPSTFVKRDVYREYGNFSIGFKVAADQEFLLRIWDKIKVGFIPEVIVTMRVGGISTSQFKRSYAESFAASLINGCPPWKAFYIYNFEMLKNSLMNVFIK